MRPRAWQTRLGDRGRLLLLSFLMLFIELALIRWTGSEVLYLAYFSNFVLLASFFGIGLGFLLSSRPGGLLRLTPLLLGIFVLAILVNPVIVQRPSDSEVLYFGGERIDGPPAWVVLPVIYLAVAAIMATIADGVARTFRRLPPLEAYRVDIAGSLLGIVAFSLLSFLQLPPLAWGVVAGLALVSLLAPRPGRLGVAGLAVMLVALGWESAQPGIAWSPYYRLQWASFGVADDRFVDLAANGVPIQAMQTLPHMRRSAGFYFSPYLHLRHPPGEVLIIGAGTGNDVAVALASGAGHVDAVEIDPRVQRLGVELHPETPYADPRVEAHIDDGRAFLEQTGRRYDLILFALPDSLTLVSGQSSLRLESYLFTAEAAAAARDHLKPGGVVAEYNYFRSQWLVDRLAGTLQGAFGQAPCVDTSTNGPVSLVDGVGPDLVCDSRWAPSGPVVAPATDDHPFLYVPGATIPPFYLLSLLALLVASVGTVALLTFLGSGLRPAAAIPYLDLALMGAAFLLIESKSVVQFALLFGSTWHVNALVFGGILVTVLAAVETARRLRLPSLPWLFALLGLSLMAGYAVPPEWLLHLPAPLRFAAAVMVDFGPVYAANLVFAERFRAIEASAIAFGVNLIGALLGGVLEYASLLAGYRALVLVAGVLYLGAFLLQRRPPAMSTAALGGVAPGTPSAR